MSKVSDVGERGCCVKAEENMAIIAMLNAFLALRSPTRISTYISPDQSTLGFFYEHSP